LTAGGGDVGVGGVGGEAADAVVDAGAGHGVVDVKEVVGAEIGVESHAQQSALAAGIDVDVQEGGGQQRAGLDDSEVAARGGYERPGVGGEGHGSGAAEACGGEGFLEAEGSVVGTARSSRNSSRGRNSRRAFLRPAAGRKRRAKLLRKRFT